MTDTINASQLMLQQMQQMRQQIGKNAEINPLMLKAEPAAAQVEQVSFTDLLGSAIKHVNSYQQRSGALKKDFEMGKEGVDLVDVMIASEKASVAFSALLETRNKLLQAYRKIESVRV